jgi:hypothetical protein
MASPSSAASSASSAFQTASGNEVGSLLRALRQLTEANYLLAQSLSVTPQGGGTSSGNPTPNPAPPQSVAAAAAAAAAPASGGRWGHHPSAFAKDHFRYLPRGH